MAKVTTTHVDDMTESGIKDGTAQYLQVRDPKGDVEAWNRWDSFDTDNDEWRTANPGETDPTVVPFAAVVDVDSPLLGERLFIQSRFVAVHNDNGRITKKQHPAAWAQINSTNFPGMDISAYKQAAKAMYDAQRLFEDLVPL